MMVLAILAAAACLAVTTIMYSPRMRTFHYYRPVALFFLFEGIWIVMDYAFRQLIPDNVFMDLIHYIGILAVVIYFIICIVLGAGKKKAGKSGK